VWFFGKLQNDIGLDTATNTDTVKRTMITKTVDKRGRIVLGRQFANTTVVVDESDANRIVIIPAKVLPAQEKWLYQNKKAAESVLKGVQQARTGKFAKKPPDIDADPEEHP
jgi:hypothetical protein